MCIYIYTCTYHAEDIIDVKSKKPPKEVLGSLVRQSCCGSRKAAFGEMMLLARHLRSLFNRALVKEKNWLDITENESHRCIGADLQASPVSILLVE